MKRRFLVTREDLRNQIRDFTNRNCCNAQLGFTNTTDGTCLVPPLVAPIKPGEPAAQACPIKYSWKTGAWSACSKTCGPSTETRTVTCTRDDTGATVSDSNCSGSSKPAISTSCNKGDCTTYAWMTATESTYSACSTDCGGGTQTLFGSYCRATTGSVRETVSNSFCTAAATNSKPESSRSCNTQICPTAWSTPTSWSACSRQCGGGTQTRTTKCMETKDGSTSQVNDNKCSSGSKPTLSLSCNTAACPTFSWLTGDFGACTKTCGGGRCTRTVVCKQDSAATVDDSKCSGRITKPATADDCNTQACPKPTNYEWVTETYSACSLSCGDGTQDRAVRCRDTLDKDTDSKGAIMSETKCSGNKPSTSKACNLGPCPVYEFKSTAWSSCSKTCGPGTQTRTTKCVNSATNPDTDVAETQCTSRGVAKPSVSQACHAPVTPALPVAPGEPVNSSSPTSDNLTHCYCLGEQCEKDWVDLAWGGYASCAEYCQAEWGDRAECADEEEDDHEEDGINLTLAKLQQDLASSQRILKNACVKSERAVPPPASAWFQQCNVARCTKTEDLEDGDFFQWDLDASFPSGTKDFAYQPGGSAARGTADGHCFFPVYNRTEIRALLGGLGAAGGNGSEAWVLISGGSNSFGMAGTVMKAVHNTGVDDGKDGKGISETMSRGMNYFNDNCIVDTIRHLDGRTTVRKLKVCPKGYTSLDPLEGNADMQKDLQDFLAETEALFTPGSIRVTQTHVYYFSGFQALLELMSKHSATNPWKRYLAYAHSVQRGQVQATLPDMVKTELCNRPGKSLCFVGTKHSRVASEVDFQKTQTYPNSPVHLLDTAWLARNNFEFSGGHALQSLHLYMFQLMLNSYDLDIALTEAQRTRAVAQVGCPEALQLPKKCNSANNEGWNTHNTKLCDFVRDDITPHSEPGKISCQMNP
eukprot:g1677.t1